jgi:signal transduction histidine kinase
VGVALVLMLMWGFAAYRLLEDFQNFRASEIRAQENLTEAFAEHALRTFGEADQVTRFVRNEYLEHRAAFNLHAPEYRDFASSNVYSLAAVIVADGELFTSTVPSAPMSLSDRDHFRWHKDHEGDELYISKPVLGRVSKRWSIQVTRRISEVDGSFAGVAVASISAEYFTNFFSRIELGEGDAVALIGMDGIVRTRLSSSGISAGEDIGRESTIIPALRAGRNEGTVVKTSAVDGVMRIMSFKRLGALPLFVVYSVPERTVTAQWQAQVAPHVLLDMVFSVVLLLLAWLVMRAFQRRDALLREVQESRLQVEQASELKSKFLARVSHELRTPLNGILGFSEVIRDSSPDPEAKEFAGHIHDSGRHLHALVNTLLDLAKLDAGGTRVRHAKVDIVELVEQTVGLHRVSARKAGLDLNTELPGEPVHVVSDRMLLVQVLHNLLHNAIKFTAKGRVNVRLQANHETCTIEVEDTGPGIAREQLERLFERGFHASSADTSGVMGSGLGMALSHELMELMGGQLYVRSKLGNGSTFVVVLKNNPDNGAQIDDSND